MTDVKKPPQADAAPADARAAADEDVLRKVLAMNPALRPANRTTGEISRSMMATLLQSQEMPAALSVAGTTGAAGGSTRLLATLTQLKQEYKQTQTQRAQRLAELDKQLQQLGADQRAALTRLLHQVFDQFLRFDPELLDPATHQLLNQHETFLSAIGFSVEALITYESTR